MQVIITDIDGLMQKGRNSSNASFALSHRYEHRRVFRTEWKFEYKYAEERIHLWVSVEKYVTQERELCDSI